MRNANSAQKPIEYIITTLAEYQTSFWSGVAKLLRDAGHDVSLISFDDNSTRSLRDEGFRVYALKPSDWSADWSDEEIERTLSEFGLTDTPYWYVHEKSMFRLRDEAAMDKKLCTYLKLCEGALADVAQRGRTPVVVQELGGFLSVIAAFVCARRRDADNWFIEPSFYRGRCFWSPNTFMAKVIGPGSRGDVSVEALSYLADAQAKRSIVIPIKDAHQYKSPASKLLNWGNLRRLAGKLSDKYLRGRRQEFNHLLVHVQKHVEAVVAAVRLRKHYTPLETLGRFVYYPLHVPGDMALTLRSPSYLDQPSFIETLSRQLPRGVRLAIKEHPAMIGALGASTLLDLLSKNRNIALIDPRTNNYDVMASASVIVSVNSKSGAEALLLDRPVVVMGDAFYRGSGITTDMTTADGLKSILETMLNTPQKVPHDRRAEFFSEVWRQSYPGELYVDREDNLTAFADSMIAATQRRSA